MPRDRAARLAQVAAAHEACKHYAAERALDDPVKLERAARIIRLALARQRITLDDLTDLS